MKLFRSTVLLAASLLAASVPVAAAHALPNDSGKAGMTRSGAELTLFVTNPDRDFTYSTSLQCLPNGGDHSDIWTACYALKQADGNFDRIQPREWETCTKEYKPVIFTAVGHWKGDPVYWSKQFSNQCEGNRATGGVFDF
ncbi:SSI family serine proteinase inhibitor [Streptomyces sp. NPDC000927]|uniref:SSI family serine proteinase inhibitor n=1 Tax=Streptomyces sp. NPDC000927 TaxID=3154371 RepID=UPI0033343DB3